MFASVSPRAIAGLGVALLALSACATNKDTAEDAPKFTVTGQTTLSQYEDVPVEGADSESPEPSEPSHLRQEDGTYLLTKKEAGPGVVNEIVATYSGVEPYGFQTLRVELDNRRYDGAIGGSAPTGVLQWATGGALVLSVQATNLSGDEADLDNNAEWQVALLDDTQSHHLKEGEDFVVDCESGECTLVARLTDPGDFVAEISIRQAGYEPFVIHQPIIVAA